MGKYGRYGRKRGQRRAATIAVVLTSSKRESLVQNQLDTTKIFEDEISNIPNDCFREICKYLDHNDLDEISTVNQRMYNLTVIGRALARKLKGEQLVIKETHNGLLVRVCQEPRHLSMHIFREINGKTKILKYENEKESPYEYLSQPFRESLLPNAVYFINRYTFDGFRVGNILIDGDLMGIIALALRTHIREIYFNQTPFIYNDESIAKRFLNFALQSKPVYLTLNIDGIAKEFDIEFLRRFAVTSVNLFIEDKVTKTALVVDKTFSSSLCLFNSLVFDQLKVGTDWITEAIIKRLEGKVWGKMSFTVNRSITTADITKYLTTGHGYTFDATRHFIQLIDTPFSVIFGTFQEPKT